MKFMCHFADLGPLGNYPGSPFLPSDSEILLDSPEQEDIGKMNPWSIASFACYRCVVNLAHFSIKKLKGATPEVGVKLKGC